MRPTKTLKQRMKEKFRRKKFCAVYIAGPKEVVWRCRGDNRGTRPIRVGVTSALEDSITTEMDRYSAVCPQGVWFRLWVINKAQALKAKTIIQKALIERTDPMRKAWRGLDPDTDIDMLRFEIAFIVESSGIQCWSDDELIGMLEGAALQDMKQEAA